MKLLLDFIPIALFFVTYKVAGIYTATMVAIIATAIQVAWGCYSTRTVNKTQLITLGVMVVFGGSTLLLKDDMFIKLKPTVVYWIFALTFFVSKYFGSKIPLMQRMTGKTLTMAKEKWQQLDHAWGIFFILMGFANLYVVYNFDTDTWVNFKLFGTLTLTLIFIIAQAIFMGRYAKGISK